MSKKGPRDNDLSKKNETVLRHGSVQTVRGWGGMIQSNYGRSFLMTIAEVISSNPDCILDESAVAETSGVVEVNMGRTDLLAEAFRGIAHGLSNGNIDINQNNPRLQKIISALTIVELLELGDLLSKNGTELSHGVLILINKIFEHLRRIEEIKLLSDQIENRVRGISEIW